MARNITSTRPRSEKGIALISVLLLLGLASALLVGFIALVRADRRTALSSDDQLLAYGAAHAGLEQLTSRLGELFATNYHPTSAQVLALTAGPPDFRDANNQPYVTFTAPGNTPVTGDVSGYQIIFTDSGGYPAEESTPRTIASGSYQGLQGIATPYTIEVTSRTRNGSEVRMRRTMQTMLIPAFQFGIFSELDLAFHSGTDFNFGGRVHTNGNLYLAEGSGVTLTLGDRVTVYGEVIRKRLPNGVLSSLSWTGNVNIPDSTHRLGAAEGSVVDSVGSTLNEPAWTNAVARLNRKIINGRTGVTSKLELPLVNNGAQPIDLVRRPPTDGSETTSSVIYAQRYFSRASLRILLSDYAADITNLPGVTATAPLDLTTFVRGGAQSGWYAIPGKAPIAAVPSTISGAYGGTNYDSYFDVAGTPLVRGFIKIERKDSSGNWSDVTQEVLSLGFTGRRLSTSASFDTLSGSATCTEPNPSAIIRLQRVADDAGSVAAARQPPQSAFVTGAPITAVALNTATGTTCGATSSAFTYGATTVPAGTLSAWGGNYWPNMLYDTREGDPRDSSNPSGLYLGGVMHYIELDVANLAKWFAGTIGTTGTSSDNSDGGYVVYISDRRTNKSNPASPAAGLETGEYGFEDVVNPSSTDGMTHNGVLDVGEDLNGNSTLETYGEIPYYYNPASAVNFVLLNGRTGTTVSTASRPWSTVTAAAARQNAPLFFRRAVKLVNGADSSGSTLRVLPTGMGLTIVTENPVYVQGNFNTYTAWGSGGTNHRAAAIIADAVTLLSNNWNDLNSFNSPHASAGRAATNTWYRVAVVAGKTPFFAKQSSWGSTDAGSDGGIHNFLRFMESWSNMTAYYRGSIVSFYYSRQANGIFKYGGANDNVYYAPTRNYTFDTEFLTFSLLPPKPPSFRDVNSLTFRQVLRPTQ